MNIQNKYAALLIRCSIANKLARLFHIVVRFFISQTMWDFYKWWHKNFWYEKYLNNITDWWFLLYTTSWWCSVPSDALHHNMNGAMRFTMWQHKLCHNILLSIFIMKSLSWWMMITQRISVKSFHFLRQRSFRRCQDYKISSRFVPLKWWAETKAASNSIYILKMDERCLFTFLH